MKKLLILSFIFSLLLPLESYASYFKEAAGTDDDIPEAGDYTNLTAGLGLAHTPTGTLLLKNSDTLAGNPALLTTECLFTADGLLCEGTTADAIEIKLAFPNPAVSDKTITFFNATDTVVGKDTTDTLTNKTLAAANNVIDADTAVALASDPADCAASNFATAIAASGALTCAQPALGADTTGNYAGSSSEGGAATTAAALAANGANCSAGNYPLGVDAAGAVETCAAVTAASISSEVDTGTDVTKFVNADALAGSNLGEKAVEVVPFDFTSNTTVGDGKFYFIVPSSLTGMNLVEARAEVITAGTTNPTNIDLARCATTATGNLCSGAVVDMLSTNMTIDSGENSNDTAATAAVIDAANDDVTTGQVVRVDIDAVSATAAVGLIVTLVFRLP